MASGSAALDVAHTGGVGDWVDVDLVTDETVLAYWLGVVLQREVTRGLGLRDFRTLREAIFQSGRSLLAGSTFRPHDVDVLNRLARGTLLPAEMSESGALVLPVADVDQAHAHLAREAVTLFTGPLRARVRECAAQDCALLFVDTSRPGRRRWCSMARCGNIAKTRTYRGRASPTVGPSQSRGSRPA